MKKAEYKVATSTTGIAELEKTVTELLNQGWKPLGGISFNHGYPYQALARVATVPHAQKEQQPEHKQRMTTANEAMKRIGELT